MSLCTALTRIRAPAAIVFDDCFPPRRLFKHALIQAEALIVLRQKDVNIWYDICVLKHVIEFAQHL